MDKSQPKVLVLMSTYNGAKWLREQLDSVLSQENVEVSLLVRDDGSTDESLSILEEYANISKNITYYAGNNVGVINSFNDLMANEKVSSYRYVAFCDQDDVWLPTKLERAVSMISPRTDRPCLYCSQLKVVDQKLKGIGYFYKKEPRFNYYTSLVQNCATGCTEVFNHSAVELYREGIGSHMEMHDYWMFLVCLHMGEVFWDSESLILYRQHESNVIGARKKRISTALMNYGQSGHRARMTEDFVAVYKYRLPSESQNILKQFVHSSESFLSRVNLFADPKYHGYTAKVTVNFKIRALLGRMY